MKRIYRRVLGSTLLVIVLIGRAIAAGTVIPSVVLPAIPGAGVGYLEDFAPGSVHALGLRNLTTPEAARRLAQLMQIADAPISGQRLGTPAYIVDAPGFRSSVEAGPQGAILINREYLETLTGLRVDGADPRSVNRAVDALFSDPRKAAHIEFIMAHEMGHFTQGHTPLSFSTQYRTLMQGKIAHLLDIFSVTSFRNQLLNIQQRYLADHAAQVRAAATHPEYQRQLFLDCQKVSRDMRATDSIQAAMRYLTQPDPPLVGAATPGAPAPSRAARLLAVAEYIHKNSEYYAPYLDHPVQFQLRDRGLPVVLRRSGGRIQLTGVEAARAQILPKEANLHSHIHEYLADEFALHAMFKNKPDVGRALDFMIQAGSAPGQGVDLMETHPTKTARVLNLINEVERHPSKFAASLSRPLEVHVVADQPPVILRNVGGKVVVSGRSRIAKLLALPEQAIYTRRQQTRTGLLDHVAERSRMALPEPSQKYCVADGETFDPIEGNPSGRRVRGSTAAPAEPASAMGRVKASFHQDFKGGILTNALISLGTETVSRLAQGSGIRSAVREANVSLATPEFLLGNLLAGSVGAAAMAGLVSLPAVTSATGYLGHVTRALPGLAGAFLAAHVASNAIGLMRQGKFSAANLWNSLDLAGTSAQIAGAALASNLALVAFGPGIAPILGGIAGALLAGKAVEKLRPSQDSHSPSHTNQIVDAVGDAPSPQRAGRWAGVAPEPKFEDLRESMVLGPARSGSSP